MATRYIWHSAKLKLGEIITFQHKRYKVINQETIKQDTAHFKGVYYTLLTEI